MLLPFIIRASSPGASSMGTSSETGTWPLNLKKHELAGCAAGQIITPGIHHKKVSCPTNRALNHIKCRSFRTVFTLSNTLLYWRAHLRPVPLLLRVSTGKKMRKNSVTDLQGPSSFKKMVTVSNNKYPCLALITAPAAPEL